MQHDVVHSDHSGRSPRASRLWLGYPLVGVIAIVAYYRLPAGSDGQAMLYSGIAGSAALAVLAAMALHRPAGMVGWALLAAAQVSYTIGDVLYFLRPEDVEAEYFYLGMYVFLLFALGTFVRRRTPGRDTATFIDAAVLAVSAGLIWWVYLLAPLASGAEAGLATIAYPVLDLLVLAVVLRLLLDAGARTVAFRLLAVSQLLMLCADLVYAVQTGSDTFRDGSWVDAVWMLSYLALGAAALHPSMRWLDAAAPSAVPALGTGRIAVLAGAALLPVVMLVAPGRAALDHLPVVAFCAVVLLLLVVGRLLGMARAERQRAVVDPLTGLYADGVFEANLHLEGERAADSNGYLGLVLVELDHFRPLVEAYGQPAGDLVLRDVAGRMRTLTRPGDLVARITQDPGEAQRFAILLPGLDPYRVGQLAEAVRDAVSQRQVELEPGTAVRATATVGMAALPFDAAAPEQLLRVAQQALAAAVTAGRNRTYTWRGPVNLAALAIHR